MTDYKEIDQEILSNIKSRLRYIYICGAKNISPTSEIDEQSEELLLDIISKLKEAEERGRREMAKDISESYIGTPRTTYKGFEAKAFYEGFKFGFESIKFIARAKLDSLLIKSKDYD